MSDPKPFKSRSKENNVEQTQEQLESTKLRMYDLIHNCDEAHDTNLTRLVKCIAYEVIHAIAPTELSDAHKKHINDLAEYLDAVGPFRQSDNDPLTQSIEELPSYGHEPTEPTTTH